MIIFKSIHINANGNILFFLWLSSISLYTCAYLFYSFLCRWAFRLLPISVTGGNHNSKDTCTNVHSSTIYSIQTWKHSELLVFDMLLLPPKFLVSESIRHGHSSLFVFCCSVTKLCLTLCSPMG